MTKDQEQKDEETKAEYRRVKSQGKVIESSKILQQWAADHKCALIEAYIALNQTKPFKP